MISEICTIALTKGLCAIIESDDLEKVSQYKYHAMRHGNTWYAARSTKGGTVFMHEDIIGVKEGFEIDHKNGNGLDCRRENLRHCTRSQNLANQRRRKYKGSSKYKGASYKKQKRKWAAQIRVNGKNIWLGYFETEIEAAQAYDLAAIEHFGTFARINEYSRKELENGQI
jgi:hypothetical protein